jgi:hypothetical protein
VILVTVVAAIELLVPLKVMVAVQAVAVAVLGLATTATQNLVLVAVVLAVTMTLAVAAQERFQRMPIKRQKTHTITKQLQLQQWIITGYTKLLAGEWAATQTQTAPTVGCL